MPNIDALKVFLFRPVPLFWLLALILLFLATFSIVLAVLVKRIRFIRHRFSHIVRLNDMLRTTEEKEKGGTFHR